MAENKKILTVTQQVKELVYDIQNKAYLTGQAREAEGKRITKLPLICKRVMMRKQLPNPSFIGKCISSLKSLLGEYLSEDKVQATI